MYYFYYILYKNIVGYIKFAGISSFNGKRGGEGAGLRIGFNFPLNMCEC
jgi:hypothetical protein